MSIVTIFVVPGGMKVMDIPDGTTIKDTLTLSGLSLQGKRHDIRLNGLTARRVEAIPAGEHRLIFTRPAKGSGPFGAVMNPQSAEDRDLHGMLGNCNRVLETKQNCRGEPADTLLLSTVAKFKRELQEEIKLRKWEELLEVPA